MNRKILLVLSLVFGLFAVSLAQDVDPEMAKQSADILTRMRKVELLNQILPIALTKDQIQQILPVLERIREKNRKLIEQEHKDLLEFDRSSSDAMDAAIKGEMPKSDYVRNMEAFYKANDIRRQVAMGENIDILMPKLKEVCNQGQMKVMANSLTLAFFEPDLTAGDVNDEVKERVFCREILLDPLTYDLLVQMSK